MKMMTDWRQSLDPTSKTWLNGSKKNSTNIIYPVADIKAGLSYRIQ